MWALVFILSVSDADILRVGTLETYEQCTKEITRLVEESSYYDNWACVLAAETTQQPKDIK